MVGGALKKSYTRSFQRIAKSFKWFDKKAKDVKTIDDLQGVNITARKRSQIESGIVAGWDVIVSPKKNYIIIYNTKRGKNKPLAKIIAKRIELIREQIYEVQFPPAQGDDRGERRQRAFQLPADLARLAEEQDGTARTRSASRHPPLLA